MSKITHHMNRRTMLKAAGISLALPWMESLAGPRSKVPPRRFCSIYFPYGVSLPKQEGEFGKWNWFPKGSGRDFTFNKSLEVLERASLECGRQRIHSFSNRVSIRE